MSNNGLHSKPAVYDQHFYFWRPHWRYRTNQDGPLDEYYEFWLEFPGIGDTPSSRVTDNGLFTREQALHHVNEVRRANVHGARFEERMLFIPKHIIVFPYASGWKQGTAILATSDDNCRELQRPHAFEITMKGYPKRRHWKTRPSEFPIYERTNTF